MNKHMRWLIALLTGLALAGCASPEPEQAPIAAPPTTTIVPSTTVAPTTTAVPTTTAPSGPGDPAVYKRITKLRDCDALQEQFDLAEQTSKREGEFQGTRWSEIGVAYMEAADARMREVGCY